MRADQITQDQEVNLNYSLGAFCVSPRFGEEKRRNSIFWKEIAQSSQEAKTAKQ